MTIGIYSIVNDVNGKMYIGLSVDIERRVYAHKWLLTNRRHYNPHLQSAWTKYGSKNFRVEILYSQKEYLEEELVEKERELIAYHDTYKNGYNRSLGGDGFSGYVHDAKRLKQMSDFMKGNAHGVGREWSEEQYGAIAKYWEGIPEEEMEKRRETGRNTMRELWEREEFREYHRRRNAGNNFGKGVRRTEEEKENLSKLHSGTGNPFYGKKHDKKTLQELSVINKKRWEDPSHRKKMLESFRKFNQTDEYKKKMSKAISGENNGNAKVTKRQAVDIRLRYLKGERLKSIIENYPQYSLSGLGKIARNESWKNLPNTIEELGCMLINYQTASERNGRSND